MDYSLAALKVMIFQLREADPANASPNSHSLSLGGILFQRAWLQGVLVSVLGDDRLILDDGTGVVELSLSGEFRLRDWRVGMYVMVVGGCFVRPDEDCPLIKVHKMVDLSAFPDREAMWYLEVIEAYRLFYKRIMED
ncbi:hypothetical protein MLD38_023249 [Melastoma candidum]|uniref:Uncharacterized protein n=1 Tax=Melastoma candidum TaxID=119954 RepID=A0ACB9QQU5_9MYRT|nr:hypothetical protein MLD38_023249 [Melastoma candidum]